MSPIFGLITASGDVEILVRSYWCRQHSRSSQHCEIRLANRWCRVISVVTSVARDANITGHRPGRGTRETRSIHTLHRPTPTRGPVGLCLLAERG